MQYGVDLKISPNRVKGVSSPIECPRSISNMSRYRGKSLAKLPSIDGTRMPRKKAFGLKGNDRQYCLSGGVRLSKRVDSCYIHLL